MGFVNEYEKPNETITAIETEIRVITAIYLYSVISGSGKPSFLNTPTVFHEVRADFVKRI